MEDDTDSQREESPLLGNQTTSPVSGGRSSTDPPKITPVPWGQVIIVVMTLLVEPLASQTIFPFVAKLVNELDVTKGDTKLTGYYVGFIESLFFFCQGCAVLHWGRLSDRIGRKPVLLIGLSGTCLSMLCFGMSTTYPGVVISRGMSGLLNGNIGVTKTVLAELTDDTNRPTALAVFPFAWLVGATSAALIGGTLQHPQDKFPRLFGNAFWSKHPFFLPCFVVSSAIATAFLSALFFLNETLKTKEPDAPSTPYGTFPASSTCSNQHQVGAAPTPKAPTLKEALTRPVIIAILNYALAAILDIAMFGMFSVYLAVPISSGGLNLPPEKVALANASLGLLLGGSQALLLARLVRWLGPRKLLMSCLSCSLLVFLAFPMVHLWVKHTTPENGTSRWLWIGIVLITIPWAMFEMGGVTIFLFITSASPSPQHLGTVNGAAQTVISFTRAFGPAAANSLFAFSVKHDILGGYAVYLVLSFVTLAAFYSASLLPKEIASTPSH
ncbi:major facilitator superfamily domain-containing protein [Cantharellus anzutake]|uniref:major facilitator superfamily domain-containing protein n=1 Tax=Cantharellus anzutake TaxID=1750568 RepID=UPI0019031858|nr:major facilitator superfamily domain-containing protein [Cantharellus anzutake]KAF8338764.1 major facilitator superfamily domain-containing protein [Cantharellus anzutake]